MTANSILASVGLFKQSLLSKPLQYRLIPRCRRLILPTATTNIGRCHPYRTTTNETTQSMKVSRQATASVAIIVTAATVLSFQPIPTCRAERYRFFSSSSKSHKESVDVVMKNDGSTAGETDKELHHSKQWVETTTKPGKERNDRNPSCPFYGCPLLPVDVHYNTAEYKEAFTVMRDDKRIVVMNKDAATLLSSSANDQHATLTLIGYKGGALQGQINQDRALIVAPYSIIGNSTLLEETIDAPVQSAQRLHHFVKSDRILLGVFDGHAPLGEKVSEYVTVELPKLLAQKLWSKALDKTEKGEILSEQDKVELTKDALTETFIELDRTVPADPSGGCTASIILKQEGKVYVANAGDSRSFVAAYRPSTKNVTIAYISREDKPCVPEERARVEARGGQVYIPSRGTSRVVYHDPITGAPTGLAMSRSIGDWEAGKMGVIPDPIVDVLDINNVIANVLLDDIDDEQDSDSYQVNPMLHAVNGEQDDVHLFAVSATDGMMDYLSAIEISRVLAHSLFDDSGAHPVTAVEHLIFAAANAWQEAKQGRYRDDIAIAVSVLHQPKNRSSGVSVTINPNGDVDIGDIPKTN